MTVHTLCVREKQCHRHCCVPTPSSIAELRCTPVASCAALCCPGRPPALSRGARRRRRDSPGAGVPRRRPTAPAMAHPPMAAQAGKLEHLSVAVTAIPKHAPGPPLRRSGPRRAPQPRAPQGTRLPRRARLCVWSCVSTRPTRAFDRARPPLGWRRALRTCAGARPGWLHAVVQPRPACTHAPCPSPRPMSGERRGRLKCHSAGASARCRRRSTCLG